MNPLLEQHRAAFNTLESELYQLIADINPNDAEAIKAAKEEINNRFEQALSDARIEMGVRVYDGKLNAVVFDREVLRDITQPAPVDEKFERVGNGRF